VSDIPEWVYRDVGCALEISDRGFLTVFILVAAGRHTRTLTDSILGPSYQERAEKQLIEWGERLGIPGLRLRSVLDALSMVGGR